MPARVCLFTDSLEPSGMGEHMLALAGELRERYVVSFVCPGSPSGVLFLKRAHTMGLDSMALPAMDQDRDSELLSAWLATRGVDVFHAHAGIGWEGHAGIYAAVRAGVRSMVRTEHLPYLLTDPEQQAAHRHVIGYVNRVICVSQTASETFLRAGIPAEKIRTVRNGIPPRRSVRDRQGLRARLGLPASATVVLTVARFEEQKGYRYLLDAIPMVLAAQPRTYFVWVGVGPLFAEFQQQTAVRGLAGNIRLLGYRTDVPELMAAADLLVLPSLFEGLPVVVLEAMSAQLPVVATRVIGTVEAIEDGTSGRLVPPTNSTALAAAIVEALEHPQLGAAWAAAAQWRVEHELGASRMAAEVASIYDELLAASSSLRPIDGRHGAQARYLSSK